MFPRTRHVALLRFVWLWLLVALPAAANQDCIRITIGNGPNEQAVGTGRLVGGGGMNNAAHSLSGATIGLNTQADAAAFLIASGINAKTAQQGSGPSAVANGNVVIIRPANSGGAVMTAGLYSGIRVERIRRPAPPPPPPPGQMPRVENHFGPAGGTVTINKDGSITKRFFGSGWSVIGNVSFQASDTLASINQQLFSSLAAQGGNLPQGYYFALENDGVALVNNVDGDPFTVTVEDSLQFTQPGVVRGIDLCIDLWDTGAYPQPYSISGAGGSFPTQGTGGGGSWGSALPPHAFVSTIAVPFDTVSVDRVRVFGLNHTYVGDLQLVLWDSWGRGYNLVARPPSSGDFLPGTYDFVPSGGATLPAVGNVPPGVYDQHFGSWPTGALDIHDLPISTASCSEGDWTLAIYDWEAVDVGSCSGWTLEANFGVPSAPLGYCTAGTSGSGCAAHISATANPSVSSAHSCFINVAGVEGQKNSILFYGINNAGFAPQPWSPGGSSFLCVKAPTQRTFTQNSGGSLGGCDGSLFLDWNAYRLANPSALGSFPSVGDKAFVQAWYRDPASPKTTSLSDAVELTYVP